MRLSCVWVAEQFRHTTYQFGATSCMQLCFMYCWSWWVGVPLRDFVDSSPTFWLLYPTDTRNDVALKRGDSAFKGSSTKQEKICSYLFGVIHVIRAGPKVILGHSCRHRNSSWYSQETATTLNSASVENRRYCDYKVCRCQSQPCTSYNME